MGADERGEGGGRGRGLTRTKDAGFSTAHYLVVEDDPVLAQALCRFLRTTGARATAASTIAGAMEFIGAGAPIDGLLLDVGLPDGSGLELLAAARARGVHAPALVLTGHHDADTLAAAQLHGAQFLPKPPREENLRAFIDATLEFRRATRFRLDELVAEWSAKYGLTPREEEVLLLACTGIARGDLAGELGVQETTIRTTVRRLLRKAGQFSLGDLTAKVHRELFGHE